MIERLALSALSTTERHEVDEALQAPLRPQDEPKGRAAYLKDNHDVVAIWMLGVFAGCGGIGLYLAGALVTPFVPEALAIAGVALLAFTGWTAVRTWNLRGCLSTSFGTFIVRGPRLTGVRHAHVKSLLKYQLRNKGGRFTVLELEATNGKKLTVYCHGNWARGAVAAIQRGNPGAKITI